MARSVRARVEWYICTLQVMVLVFVELEDVDDCSGLFAPGTSWYPSNSDESNGMNRLRSGGLLKASAFIGGALGFWTGSGSPNIFVLFFRIFVVSTA